MATSERARTARRARLKERRVSEAFFKEIDDRLETYWREAFIPIDNLPDFIQDIAKRTNWKPKWNECYTNAILLGFRLDDFGFDVEYCEAIVEQGDYEKSMGLKGKGHPFSHAWLRVNGRDINISSNGAPLNIYRRHKMVVMPIKRMRKANGYGAEIRLGEQGEHWDYLGECLAYKEFSEHPEVKPYVSDMAMPGMLTEHTTSSDAFWTKYDRW